jgi:hypothetical protein
VDGVDLDEASIISALEGPVAQDLAGRVTFGVRDAATLRESGPYAVVTIFEALHDMSDPVGVLSSIRAGLAADGRALIVDERVADTFTAPGDAVERIMYGWSVSHCLPASAPSRRPRRWARFCGPGPSRTSRGGPGSRPARSSPSRTISSASTS